MTAGPGRRGMSKPCACGRPGCMVVQRDNEQPCTFRDRLTASRGCANRLRARSAEQQAEIRALDLDSPMGGEWFLATLRNTYGESMPR